MFRRSWVQILSGLRFFLGLTLVLHYFHKNCVDVAVDRAGYQSKNGARKNYSSSFLHFFLQGQPLQLLVLLTITAKKKSLFADIHFYNCMELKALLSSRLSSHVHKVLSCRVKIFICVCNNLRMGKILYPRS